MRLRIEDGGDRLRSYVGGGADGFEDITITDVAGATILNPDNSLPAAGQNW